MKLSHPKREPHVEVVLEDGRFARVRRVTRGDWILAAAACGQPINPAQLIAVIVTLTTTIDDERVTMNDWLEADAEFTQPIVNAIDGMLKQANENPNKGGVA